MKKGEAWEINISEELKKMETYCRPLSYRDYVFYRKEKPTMSLKNTSRKYVPRTNNETKE